MISLAFALPSGRWARVVARADAAGRVYAWEERQPRAPRGTREGGRWVGDANTRAARAIASHKPATAAKQRVAYVQESRIARELAARQLDDNEPVDVVGTTPLGRRFGVEVKTLVDNRNDKITMHPESLLRKLRWARRERATLHTVVVDARANAVAPQVYYRRGVGSFRLAYLTPVRDSLHLRELVYAARGAGR